MTEQQTNPRQDPKRVADELARARDLAAAHTADKLERLRGQTERTIEERAIKQAAARDKAAAALERAKLASDIADSAEARALRVYRTRTLTLAFLMPVFAAFAAWSTAGVHAGAAAMTGAEHGTAMWWALWFLEPALLGTVAWIILCRARLTSAGGTLGPDANHIMWGCLAVSVLLNAIGHWPGVLTAQAVGSLAAHSMGPLGAAMTAHLIGVIETAITTAKPSQGAKTLSELTTTVEQKKERTSFESTSGSVRRDPARSPERAWEIPPGAVRLSLVDRPRTTAETPAEKPRRSVSEQGEGPVSEEGAVKAPRAARKERADKGTKLPSALRGSSEKSPRAMSDEELADQLDTAVRDSRLSVEPSVNAVQKCLGIGFERAKRVLALQQSRTETTVTPELTVVGSEPIDSEEGAA
jgi:hypothetical protein